MKPKTINLREALLLYEILEPYLLNEIPKDMTVIEFVGNLILQSTEDGKGAYARALTLMTGHSLEELAEFSPKYNMDMFTKSFMTNELFVLKEVFERI